MDGDLDLVLTGCDNGRCSKVYENFLATPNAPPSTPSDLLVTNLTDTTATLTWSAPTDDTTPEAGFSYNLRIGTTPGGSEVLAPMSLTETPFDGQRQIVAFGPVQPTPSGDPSWTIRGLDPGTTYYWSVQAIDAGFAGSAFATEGSFTPTAPALTVAASVWLEGPWNGTDMETDLSSVLRQDDPYDLNQSVESPTFFTDDPDGQQVVDWDWLELRTGDPTSPPMTGIAQTAALLMADGSIKALDATSAVAFSEVEAGSYYLVVGHRNHLAVMSAQPVDCSSGSCSYDFRGAQTQAYGSTPMADLSGVFGLYAGDANGNGQVQNDDKNEFWNGQAGQAGYLEADFNLNAQVQNDDKNGFWNANVGRGSQVPEAQTSGAVASARR